MPSKRARQAFEQGVKSSEDGDLLSAERHFRDALTYDLNWSKAREHLAIMLLNLDRFAPAIQMSFSCLELRPLKASAVSLLCMLLQRFKVKSIQGVDEVHLAAALGFNDLNLQPLTELVTGKLAGETTLKQPIQTGLSVGWVEAAQQLVHGESNPVFEDPLFRLCLTKGYNTHPEVELLLVHLRRQLLLASRPDEVADIYSETRIQSLIAVLIQQGINNEFVFYEDDQEKALIGSLVADVKSSLPNDALMAHKFILLSMYRPIDICFDADADPKKILKHITHRETRNILNQHFQERMEERKIAAALPSLRSLENTISKAVAEQYEENPYPRWLGVNLPGTGYMNDRLSELMPGEVISDAPDVLVAGCGTGRQAVIMAAGFGEKADIVAFDLSRASLSYAARKMKMHRFTHVTFVQNDILDVSLLDRDFDVIICTGVLHHMEEPLAGWRSLAGVLRPGGVMNVALYSELARREIPDIRAQYDSAADDVGIDGRMRQFRYNYLIDKMSDPSADRSGFGDFFTMSECRDQFFHIQEHRYAIPEIKKSLAELNLSFLGFDTQPTLRLSFEKNYPNPQDQLKLDKWWEYEQANPNAFGRMYNFWCRKPI